MLPTQNDNLKKTENNKQFDKNITISPEVIPQGAKTVMERLTDAGYEAYLVGGCVRDSIRGKAPNDWDITTNARPEEMLRVFADLHVIETGLKHGTLTVMVDHEPYEVTTYRVDGVYLDNRHPSAVTFTGKLTDDLSRRDFTVNAMAADADGVVVDVFGGAPDLQNKVIRAVGNPDTRLQEDALRIMRALRFAAVLGYEIDGELAGALHRNRALLQNVSVERIYVELSKLLCGAGADRILLEYPDVLATFIPEITPAVGFNQNNPHHAYDVWTHTVKAVTAAPVDLTVRLALLFHDLGKPQCYTEDERGGHFYGHHVPGAQIARNVMNRLHTDTATKDCVVTLVDLHDTVFDVTNQRQMKRLLAKIGPEQTQKLLAVHRADVIGQGSSETAMRLNDCDALEKMLADLLSANTCFTLKDLAVDGAALMALGIIAGPILGKIMKRLLSDVVDGILPNERSVLLHRAEEIYNAEKEQNV